MNELTLNDLCLQVLIDGTDSPPYAAINVGEGLTNPSVARDMTFDLTQEHVYVLTGDRVSTPPRCYIRLLLFGRSCLIVGHNRLTDDFLPATAVFGSPYAL